MAFHYVFLGSLNLIIQLSPKSTLFLSLYFLLPLSGVELSCYQVLIFLLWFLMQDGGSWSEKGSYEEAKIKITMSTCKSRDGYWKKPCERSWRDQRRWGWWRSSLCFAGSVQHLFVLYSKSCLDCWLKSLKMRALAWKCSFDPWDFSLFGLCQYLVWSSSLLLIFFSCEICIYC